jgi:ABC-2 type transport system ATP-binding protein
MIVAENISKNFNQIKAIDNISAEIKKGSIFGLIGTNGAGKSTFLRMLSGVYRPDTGKILIDDEEVFENPNIKKHLFYISDDQYFLPASTPKMMAEYYADIYENFDMARFNKLAENFDLDLNRKINTFSKGMKKQVSLLCGISSGCEYLFCDETFDGLDPVMRQVVKSLLAADVADRQLTPIIASHNLRELEDICDHVGLLHKGGILLNKDLDDMKTNIHKIQCVLPQEADIAKLGIHVIKQEKRGSLSIIIARGDADQIMAQIYTANPIFAEILPLTLEEIFISETEVAGYDIKKILV